VNPEPYTPNPHAGKKGDRKEEAARKAEEAAVVQGLEAAVPGFKNNYFT